MKIYDVVKNEDGSVKIDTIFSPEEVRFMLEFAIMNLLAQGVMPVSMAKYIEENPDEQQKAVLEQLDPDTLPQA